jgi:hypothetical protein
MATLKDFKFQITSESKEKDMEGMPRRVSDGARTCFNLLVDLFVFI